LYLTGLTHRGELFDLTMRWLNDDLREGDGKVITGIFLYESVISAALITGKMLSILGKIFKTALDVERIRQKNHLRERLIQYVPQRTERIEEIVQNFGANPEFYFPRLPLDAVLVLAPGARLVSIGRVKRLSRVAEKASFRLMDALLQEVKAEAQHSAEQRAAIAGLPLTSLISSPEAMQKDFFDAEIAVAGRFREKTMKLQPDALTVNDMLGFKIIGEEKELDSVAARLGEEAGITIVETQRHTGNYNAVNLLIDVELPAAGEFMKELRGLDWSIAAQRGLDPDEARRVFPAYLEQGSRTIRMEIILTTYPELMESEFGRSLHELRILQLRERKEYSGLIAQNAGYLIEYLLTLAMAPVLEVPELPIKMFGRYLPETVSAAKSALLGNNSGGSLLNAFCLAPGCPDRFCWPMENET